MDNLTHASEFVPTAMTSQDEITLHQFKVDPADLTKRIIELEREIANLHQNPCSQYRWGKRQDLCDRVSCIA